MKSNEEILGKHIVTLSKEALKLWGFECRMEIHRNMLLAMDEAVAQYKEENERLKVALSQPKDIEGLREEWNKRSEYLKKSKNVDTEEIWNMFEPYIQSKEQPKESDAIAYLHWAFKRIGIIDVDYTDIFDDDDKQAAKELYQEYLKTKQ